MIFTIRLKFKKQFFIHIHSELLKFTNIDKIDDFLETNSLPIIYNRINLLKRNLIDFGANTFIFSELARLYSILGQKTQAIRSIKISHSLAPNNRYILRSFSRLMAHYNEIDFAHDILRKNRQTKYDPWLLASEIAFASLRKKNSNLIKFGIELINSKNLNAFSLSELASSIGTVELLNGSRKKSKTLFEIALISPNDNSLAQIQWANYKEHFFDLDVKSFGENHNFEALTLGSYYNKNYRKAIENAEKWFIEMPFAKRPIMFGHHAASIFLEDEETAIKFCRAGLISNPNDPQIINNIAFSLSSSNNAKGAFEYLNKISIPNVQDAINRICLLATTGLAYYRSELPTTGREFYIQAMNEAKEKKQPNLYHQALLYFTREEILIKSTEYEGLLDQVKKIPDNSIEEIRIMKKRVFDLAEKNMR